MTFSINWGKKGVRGILCQGHYKVCIPHANTKTSGSPILVPQMYDKLFFFQKKEEEEKEKEKNSFHNFFVSP